jgi:hypothetical protein
MTEVPRLAIGDPILRRFRVALSELFGDRPERVTRSERLSRKFTVKRNVPPRSRLRR